MSAKWYLVHNSFSRRGRVGLLKMDIDGDIRLLDEKVVRHKDKLMRLATGSRISEGMSP
jgi:hypothetical protein